ncbi:MAG: hypothetical protein IGBAC_1450 [Ignavibacteriae bacterium]|nr:MAG: hypothetical protein IGBAC_1450 [Ignavibacteriota bacterium]
MKANLEFSKSELLQAFKSLKIALPKKKDEAAAIRLEIDVFSDTAKLSLIGASYTINCKSNNYLKIVVHYLYFTELVRNSKSDNIQIIIEDDKVFVGSIMVLSPIFKVCHPEEQGDVDLSINYSKIDLLRLRKNLTLEELETMNLLKKITEVEELLHTNLKKAELLLKDFGVNYKDLKNLVTSKING